MDDLGTTAVGVAALRALESARPDRLFDDPYAADFVTACREVLPQRPRDIAARRLGAAFAGHVALRTRFFDEYLLGAGHPQVVLLAAGLDARAFRLNWPAGTTLFELDRPVVLETKQRVLTGATPRCARTVVHADLGADWVTTLTAAGFRTGTPTAWLAEGLLVYLSAAEVAAMFAGITALSAPGSTISVEHGAGLPDTEKNTALQRFGALWKGGLGERTPAWLRAHGWLVRTHALSTVAASYGREVPELTGGGFLTGTLGG